MARRVARACGFERLKRRRTLFVRMVERTMRRIHFDAQGLEPRPARELLKIALRDEVCRPIAAAVAQWVLLRVLENNRIRGIRARPFESVLRGLIYERQRLLSVTRCANAIDKEGVMS